jgi:hypothetical protein
MFKSDCQAALIQSYIAVAIKEYDEAKVKDQDKLHFKRLHFKTGNEQGDQSHGLATIKEQELAMDSITYLRKQAMQGLPKQPTIQDLPKGLENLS